jgi:hypothetical protein
MVAPCSDGSASLQGKVDQGIDQPVLPADLRVEVAGSHQIVEQHVPAGLEQLPAVQPGQHVIAQFGFGRARRARQPNRAQ